MKRVISDASKVMLRQNEYDIHTHTHPCTYTDASALIWLNTAMSSLALRMLFLDAEVLCRGVL